MTRLTRRAACLTAAAAAGPTRLVVLEEVHGLAGCSAFAESQALWAPQLVGKDVEGTIGGVAASGNGQALTAAAGSPAEGIQLSITGGATGERGTVSFSKGFAFELTNLAASFTGKGSLLTSKTDGLNVTLKAVNTQKDQFNSRLEGIEKRYRAQFTALDTALMSMQSTSAYLTQQLAALSANAG